MSEKYEAIDVTKITTPSLKTRFQPEDQEITALAKSIDEVGLLQPIVVAETEEGYRLIAGQRRLRACQMLGYTEIHAHITQLPAKSESAATLIENLQRKELDPLEEAVALAEVLENEEITQSELAEMLGTARSWVGHRLALITMDEQLQDAMVTRGLSPSIALELNRITDQTDQAYYLQTAVDNGATLSVVREWVRTWINFQHPPETEQDTEEAQRVEATQVKVEAPSCLVCGQGPPRSPLKMVYVCWNCAGALESAAEDTQ